MIDIKLITLFLTPIVVINCMPIAYVEEFALEELLTPTSTASSTTEMTPDTFIDLTKVSNPGSIAEELIDEVLDRATISTTTEPSTNDSITTLITQSEDFTSTEIPHEKSLNDINDSDTTPTKHQSELENNTPMWNDRSMIKLLYRTAFLLLWTLLFVVIGISINITLCVTNNALSGIKKTIQLINLQGFNAENTSSSASQTHTKVPRMIEPLDSYGYTIPQSSPPSSIPPPPPLPLSSFDSK